MVMSGAPTGSASRKASTTEESHAIPGERLRAAIPNVAMATRVQAVLAAQLRDWLCSAAGAVPGVTKHLDRPRQVPLKSSSVRMYRWFHSPYGTPDKPAALAEIPWEYVEGNQDDIPFLGLREYWYPAMKVRELRNNEAKPMTMLGDNLVFFRDGDGVARALENRCPHRGPLLSLGQVGVLEPGTLTCRYHGMTFDGTGACVAFIADGPESPACSKVRARAYPVQERAGIVWIYLGERDAPELVSSLPHGEAVLAEDLMIRRMELPYSHLNILDNATDLAHVGTLHRLCTIFADQKPSGETDFQEVGGGLRAYFTDQGEHAGEHSLDQIFWYLPNLVYHPLGDIAPLTQGWLWFVPRDVGNFTLWMIMGLPRGTGFKAKALRFLAANGMQQPFLRAVPGADCVYGGDGPMQASQGRVVRWDQEFLTRTDKSVARVRRLLKAAHAKEIADREARGTQAAARRIVAPR